MTREAVEALFAAWSTDSLDAHGEAALRDLLSTSEGRRRWRGAASRQTVMVMALREHSAGLGLQGMDADQAERAGSRAFRRDSARLRLEPRRRRSWALPAALAAALIAAAFLATVVWPRQASAGRIVAHHGMLNQDGRQLKPDMGILEGHPVWWSGQLHLTLRDGVDLHLEGGGTLVATRGRLELHLEQHATAQASFAPRGPDAPYAIVIDDGRIEVIGTALTLVRRAQGHHVSVTHGTVRVTPRGEAGVLLPRHSQALLQANRRLIRIDARLLAAWWPAQGDDEDRIQGRVATGDAELRPDGWFFDGNTQLQVAHDDGLAPEQTFTLSCWVRPQGPGQTLVRKSPTDFMLELEGWRLEGGVRFADAGYQLQRSAVELAPGQWHHVGLVVDGGMIGLFIDGVETGRRPAPPGGLDRTGGNLVIGRYLTETFVGNVRDLRLYHRGLDAEELADLISLTDPR